MHRLSRFMRPALCGWMLLASALTISEKAKGQQRTTASEQHRLSGFWERKDDEGSGSFGGTLERIPKASLTTESVKLNEEAAARARAGDVISFGSKWCLNLQYPFMMQHSAPIDIVETPGEVAVVPETNANPRHIYLDGRSHPKTLTPSTTGHSIGRWEGDTLVVDSVGFRGGAGVPGGGRVTPNSHLIERYALSDNGEVLTVTFTWNDPTVYLKQHTYHFTYHRMNPETYALEEFCDASRPQQRESIVEPPQN